MPKPKFKRTVIWQGPSDRYFLCRILNVGRKHDDLKIIATDSESHAGAMYTEGIGHFDGTELVRSHAELTYHSDGAVLLRCRRTMSVRRLNIEILRAWPCVARPLTSYKSGNRSHAIPSRGVRRTAT